ncbi:AI-2E family transporter [Polyangium spumosum]|uniref:AI-2E family transporter n=1 Tax=Polyangium spumosum TaxID=889282 RepID=A0A6N7PX49_9BACT|nr:AI-2E family transporter [Polyangium spumosum]MRG96573.1 AI-2E family transporter [Polyangium spumosum]
MEREPVSEARARSPSTREDVVARAARGLAAVAILALSFWVLGALAGPLLLVFAGVLLAVFLRGASQWFGRHAGLSAGWSLAAVLFALAGVSVVAGWLIAPSIAAQVDVLVQRVPEAAGRLGGWLERYEWGRGLISWGSAFSMPAPRRTLSGATSVLSTSAGIATSFVVFLFVGLFLAADPGVYRRGVLRLFPVARRARARVIFDEVGQTLGRWLLGKLFSMAVVGVSTYAGLALLGVPLAATLALLASVLTFVPYVGPLAALVPAALLALLQGPALAAYVVALYLGIQFVESYLLTPLVARRTVSLPPAVTITSQVVMGTLTGGLGVVLATPLAAALLVLVKRAYVEDVLGDDSVDAPPGAPVAGVPEERAS